MGTLRNLAPQTGLELHTADGKQAITLSEPAWRTARERIGALVRENYRVEQKMSPGLAALIKKIENGSAELSGDDKRPRACPCVSVPAKAPPSGPGWVHEIKHDGFRILARHDARGIRIITRAGNDFSSRFPSITTAVAQLPVRSCLIDGEAIVCDENGLAVFELIRRNGHRDAVLCAFDLLELDGKDLRRHPIENRKALVAELLEGSDASLVLNQHYEEDGAIVFGAACRLGCDGIVSKRLGSTYRWGRTPLWVKVKNPKAPAVRREAEGDWGR